MLCCAIIHKIQRCRASQIQVTTSSAQIFSATFTRRAAGIWYLVSRWFDSWQHNVITQMFFLDEVVIFFYSDHIVIERGDSYRMWGRWREEVGDFCGEGRTWLSWTGFAPWGAFAIPWGRLVFFKKIRSRSITPNIVFNSSPGLQKRSRIFFYTTTVFLVCLARKPSRLFLNDPA